MAAVHRRRVRRAGSLDPGGPGRGVGAVRRGESRAGPGGIRGRAAGPWGRGGLGRRRSPAAVAGAILATRVPPRAAPTLGLGANPGPGATSMGRTTLEIGRGTLGRRRAAGEDHGGWRSAGVETPTGTWDPGEPVGREPDYPALFGELYRRSAAQQDPIWEAPPAVSRCRSRGTRTLRRRHGRSRRPRRAGSRVTAPSSGRLTSCPRPRPNGTSRAPRTGWTTRHRDRRLRRSRTRRVSGRGRRRGGGRGRNRHLSRLRSRGPRRGRASRGVATGSRRRCRLGDRPRRRRRHRQGRWGHRRTTGRRPFPPTCRRPGASADPSATRAWRPDEGADAEPGVPLGPGSMGRAPAPQAPAGERPGGRATRPPGEAPRRRRAPAGDGLGGTTQVANGAPGTRTAPRPGRGSSEVAGEPEVARRGSPIDTAKRAKRSRKGGERQARAWPRVVAVISWIVLVMVLCWYYVFPWLERVLPENF